MTKRIFLYTFFVGISVVVLCMLLFFGLQYKKTNDDAIEALREETAYAGKGLAIGGIEYLKTLDDTDQITWIGHDGSILYDNAGNDVNEKLNQRPEVEAALANGEGQATRKSYVTDKSTLYYALRLEDGTVLRLSRPLSAFHLALKTVSPVMWILVLVLTISGILAFRTANRIVAPINAVDLDDPKALEYPELSPLVSRIKDQNLTIAMQMGELTRKQQEFEALTDNMSEGFVLLDRHGELVSINRIAQQLAPGLKVGERIHETIPGEGREVIEKALKGIRASATIDHNGRSWELIGSPILEEEETSGAALLMMDVTERSQRERLRQEFSANVSHELKTPLTSISGFAELMMDGAVPPEKMKEFSGDIYRESQRLVSLVEDIIKLSKLDEEAEPMPFETVDLLDVTEEVVHNLKHAADKKSVRLEVVGTKVQVDGVWQVLNEMIYNLCDNAIKYNVEGGTVTVVVDRAGGEPFVKVSDTGIGIPQSDQPRVFERFYRVDKSHSKEIGGTGLGLSIVKHGAMLHNAAVDLVSEVGKGTEITIRFPMQEQAPSSHHQPEEEDAPSSEQA